MRVILSLLLLMGAGLALIILPESLFGIPKNEARGVLGIWLGSLKLFAIPICLVLLRFSKNAIIRLVTVIWGSWILIVTTLLILNLDELVPSLNGYGKIFVAVTLVVSLTIFLFSALEFMPKGLKLSATENPPVNPS